MKPSQFLGLPKYARDEIRELRNETSKYREALKSIAAFNDSEASQHLARTGSYGAFDEPGAVQKAREALPGAK